MRYLGIDLGTKKVGIAISDLTGMIASPLKVIMYEEGNIISEIDELITEYAVNKIILGLPKNMNNSIGESAERTLVFKKKLERELNIEVILQDERRTTIEAEHYMLEGNVSRKKRKMKIDGLAAAIILQTFLDKERGRK